MKFIGLAAAAACLIATAPVLAQQLAPSATLDAVKARGHIECGVHLGLPGFSFANDKGEWAGLDVDYCRSLAAAVLGDATKVKYTPTSVQQRWPMLQSGQVDLLARNGFADYAQLGVLNNGDEEAGSPGSGPLLTQLGSEYDAVLSFEGGGSAAANAASRASALRVSSASKKPIAIASSACSSSGP